MAAGLAARRGFFAGVSAEAEEVLATRFVVLRFFFQGGEKPAGLAGPLMLIRMPTQRLTCLLIHAACLATNSSRLISPLWTMSSACSQIAVVPGSAMARGTASIRLKAAGAAHSDLPCLVR